MNNGQVRLHRTAYAESFRLSDVIKRAAAEAGITEYTVVIQPDGRAFVYSPGLPAHGNLVMSHSEIGPGVDSFGNPHVGGDATY